MSVCHKIDYFANSPKGAYKQEKLRFSHFYTRFDQTERRRREASVRIVPVISVPSRRSHQALPAEGRPGPNDDDDDDVVDVDDDDDEAAYMNNYKLGVLLG